MDGYKFHIIVGVVKGDASRKYQKIHSCPNDCVLYRGEFVSLKVCQTCGLSWFKKKIDGNSCTFL